MPMVTLYDMNGNPAGELELAPDVFDVPYHESVLHQVLVACQASRRRGTHSTRTRGEVRGGGRKPWRQKGTGLARHGSRRSPLWTGGGIVFGPRPRSYRQKVPRKVRRLAMRSALSQRLREDRLTVLSELTFEEFKTRRFVALLSALRIGEPRVLVVLHRRDQKVEKSAANIPGVTVVSADRLNVADVVSHERLLATREALQQIEEVLS